MFKSIGLLPLFILFLRTTDCHGQSNRVGIIDLYGITSYETEIRECLHFSENDSISFLNETDYPIVKDRIINCILGQKNIVQVDLSFICCTDNGQWIVFIGTDSTHQKNYVNTKNTALSLPLEMKATYDSLMIQLMMAIENGDASEDNSYGHSLMNYAPARRLQERFIVYANENLNIVQEVLKSSSDPEQREIAATILAYHTDKTIIINDLLEGISDPDENVRNNVIRAIGNIADHASLHPELNIAIPADPFIHMMNSISWTDRNKSSFILLTLTGKRDAAVLDKIRAECLQSIVDMAKWKSPGHSLPGFTILGRMAGWSEEEIMKNFSEHKEESITAMLQKIQR